MQAERPDRGFPRPTPVEWLCLAAGLFLTLRYAWLLDDAYVFFRYVDNLVFLGRGLVFNEGEYVEGCSSPVWTLLLVPPRALGLNYWLIVRAYGVLAFLAFWMLGVRLRSATVPPGAPVLSFPLVYLSVLYATATYFTSGMETPLVQVAAVAFALHVLRPEQRLPAVLVALSPLVRHELALPLAIAVAWAWWRTKRFPRLTVGVAAAAGGAWMLFRIWYYADLFPNTFHLKNQVRLDWGFAYLHDTAYAYGAYAVAGVMLGLGFALWRRRADPDALPRLVLILMAAGVTAYVVKIGGDGRHYRYLAFPFCVAVCALSGLPERALQLFAPQLRAAGVAALGVVLMACFAWLHPRQLSDHPLSSNVQEERIGVIRDAEYHRQKPDLGFSPWSSGAEMEILTGHDALLVYQRNGEPPPTGPIQLREEYARFLVEIAPNLEPQTMPDSWCVNIWKRFNQRIVHHDGLTDAILARALVAPWRPGHYKQPMDQMALDLSRVQNEYGWGRGTYRRAVEDGAAPQWIADNLASIELIERKIYNDHDLFENLVLAFRSPAKITPPEVPE